MNSWAQAEGQPGLAYIFFRDGEGAGPVARNLGPERTESAARRTRSRRRRRGLFRRAACHGIRAVRRRRAAEDRRRSRPRQGRGLRVLLDRRFPDVRARRGDRPASISATTRSRCRKAGWRRSKSRIRSTIIAYQYDIVCNGVELASGAIRNHRPEIMYKAFAIAGYSAAEVEARFARHAERLQIRRAAAWRSGARHRPHRHAAGRHAEHPRGRSPSR